jgi:hypothetical protein
MKQKQVNWISPTEASKRITERVGYVVTPDDLKQQRGNGKIKNTNKVTSHLVLYDANEIDQLDASFKRVRVPADQWEQIMKQINEKRIKRSTKAS